MTLLSYLLRIVFGFFQPSFDWLFYLFTGKRELQRICSGNIGAWRTSQLAKKLAQSKSTTVRTYTTATGVDVDEAVAEILKVEGVSPADDPEYCQQLRQSLVHICGVSDLVGELDKLRTPYDKSNPQHEEYLMELWSLLQPDAPLSARISKDWDRIGFQGEDPATDFRGMGLLGLLNLHFFAKEHSEHARRVLSCSHHPKLGYSFAIVGINMTGLAVELLRTGPLREHFYAALEEGQRPMVKDFHELYCHIFCEFNQFWQDKEPENVMAFSRIRDQFRQALQAQLNSPETAALPLLTA